MGAFIILVSVFILKYVYNHLTSTRVNATDVVIKTSQLVNTSVPFRLEHTNRTCSSTVNNLPSDYMSFITEETY